jgi:subtilisin
VIAALPGKGQPGGFPADVPGVIAVGQGDENNSTEVVAPGHDILTTVPRDSYDFMTGNSFATPHVAGLAALMLELHPEWQAAQIAEELRR